MKANIKKRILLALSLISFLTLTACGNNSLSVSDRRPNASTTSSANRVATTTTTSANFGNCTNLTFYAGNSSGNVLQSICVAKSNTDLRQIKITSTSLPASQNICIITHALYDTNACGYGTYFIDLGEERCGTIDSSGSGIFTMARSDFNIVTVIRQEDLASYNSWVNGQIQNNLYPAYAVGQISANLTTPCYY